MAVPARRAKSAVPRRNPPRSAGETLAAVRTAVAWEIITRADGAPAAALLDQILPILWKLTRG